MTKGSNLISSVSRLATHELENVEVHKRAKDVFTRELTSKVIGWIGLNRAFRKKDQVLEINPVVGVRNQALEKLLAALLNEEFHPFVPPTISINLGYLMPERRFRLWLFNREAESLNVRNLVLSIVEYGFPFMESNIALSDLVRSMEAGLGFPHQLMFRLPIAYVFAQDISKAKSYISYQLEKLGDLEDPHSKSYREFTVKLHEYILSQNSENQGAQLSRNEHDSKNTTRSTL